MYSFLELKRSQVRSGSQKRKNAFTLLELAISISIAGLILFVVLSMLNNFFIVNKVKETEERMELVQAKLLLYLKKNGQFPCPADPTKSKTESDYAKGEVCSTNCSVTGISADSETFYSGDVPAQLIGLSARYAEDGYGFKFRYFVPKNLACSTKDDSSYYEKTLLYVQFNDGSNNTEIADDLAYILVSHGENGAGAYTVAGSQISVSANSSEAENSDADNIFRYNYIKNDDFDDYVRFKTKTQLLLDLDELYDYTKNYRYFREECNATSVPSALLEFCFNE